VDLSDWVFRNPVNLPEEIEANYFAAEFLAPRNGVAAWLDEHGLIDPLTADGVAQVAMYYGVSFPTAVYRLDMAGELSRAKKEALLEELGRRGSELARLHGELARADSLDMIRAAGYPRVPEATLRFARQARALDLIDQDELASISSAGVADQSDRDRA
jgi:hypothetical protein